MAGNFARITFTESVKDAQEQYGSRPQYAQFEKESGGEPDLLGPRETGFIQRRDGFYVASVGESGWPYVQFRGGPRGFLKVLDEKTLGYADYRGNRQYITTGNLSRDDRVALILMDYANRRRLKILARAQISAAPERPELAKQLHLQGYPAQVERAVIYHVEAFDWNCPQHITPRFTLEEIAAWQAPPRRP